MALERTDILHAVAVLRDLTAPSITVVNNHGFDGFVRNGVGDYTFRTTENIAFPESTAEAWAGANEVVSCGAQVTTQGVVRVLCYDTLRNPVDPVQLTVEVQQVQAGPAGTGVLPPVPTPIVPGGGGIERWFVYQPAGVAAGNVYTDWATMFAAIALLPFGEMPTVCVVDATGIPLPIPLLGMPVTGWDMRGGKIIGSGIQPGAVMLDVADGVMFDHLFEIANQIQLQVNPSVGTGVLNNSTFADTATFSFTMTLGAVVVNNGLGALVRSRGGTPGLYAIILNDSYQGVFTTPTSVGPILELVGDDSALLAQINSSMPLPPAPSWIAGGGAASNLSVQTDGGGTLPWEWGPGFTGTGFTFVFYTSRNALQGTTAQRPVPPLTIIGMQFFDTTIGLPIWWNGTIWIDAAGAPA